MRLLTEEEVEYLLPRAVTLFESQGLAVQDVIVGARVLERARQQAVGREIDFGGGDA